ncbi:hypothetical protein F5Y04DRAFT_258745 [Hypomontagnella monticulosa]|nr:hypothetical protein F5Y04DRAFT_258745 [Hypomontagnella monticulosa]
MSTPRTLLRTPARRLFLRKAQHHRQPRRSFLTIPDALSPPPHLLTAARRLPYNHAALYDLIADVDSYTHFLPYCTVSRVTQWTTPSPNSPSSSTSASTSRRWPKRADLTAGWGGFSETYTSRLLCVPSLGIVEAVSGAAVSEIPASELRAYGLVAEAPDPDSGDSGVFKSLVTRWTVQPARTRKTEGKEGGEGGKGGEEEEWSDVRLSIKYQFANPVYMAVSSAVADKVAPVMVEAFVERARRVLGETGRKVEILR